MVIDGKKTFQMALSNQCLWNASILTPRVTIDRKLCLCDARLISYTLQHLVSPLILYRSVRVSCKKTLAPIKTLLVVDKLAENAIFSLSISVSVFMLYLKTLYMYIY